MQRHARRLTAAILAAACVPALAACGQERDRSRDEVAILPSDEGAPFTVPRTEPAVPAAAGGAQATRPLQPNDPGAGAAPAAPATPATTRSATATLAATAAKAARAAGCSLRRLPIEGTDHTMGKVRYRSNPPSSGDHNPVPAPDAVYPPGKTPPAENLVHTLEHGRVEIQYAPGASKARVATLVALAEEEVKGTAGYHVLVFRNATRMPYAVAAVSWGRVLGCRRYSAKVPAAIRAFRFAFTDTAPEFIP